MVLWRAALKFSCNWSKLLVAMTAAVRLGLDINHFTIAAPGVLPLKRGSASMVWNFCPWTPVHSAHGFHGDGAEILLFGQRQHICSSCLSP